MMPFINLSDPFSILVATILFVLVLILARQTKRSVIIGGMLISFLAIVVGHSFELMGTNDPTGEIQRIIIRSITMDFIIIFMSFISYLWIDDIESKERKIKSINNSLDWFWKKA